MSPASRPFPAGLPSGCRPGPCAPRTAGHTARVRLPGQAPGPDCRSQAMAWAGECAGPGTRTGPLMLRELGAPVLARLRSSGSA